MSKSAFLSGDIDGETYLELPEGYQKPGKVWKLNKAIYGLKQSPCLCYFHLTEALKNMNLTVTDFDPCILVSKDLYYQISKVSGCPGAKISNRLPQKKP